MNASDLIQSLFALSPFVRYVAVYVDDQLASAEREGLAGASSAESDKYEELLVNPTLLKLVTQRGNIDCGGAEYVLIRYGNFFEYVAPVAGGHVSVGFESQAEVTGLVEAIQRASFDFAPLRSGRRLARTD